MPHFTDSELNERFRTKGHVERVKAILDNYRISEDDFLCSYLAIEYAMKNSSIDSLLQKINDDYLEK